eukprot:jgi/Bigna1/85414/estExt_fgenesh1_pg.C_40038
MKSNFKNCFFIYTVTKIESISFLEDIEKEVIVHSILCKHQMHIPSMLKILSQVFTEEREYQQKEQLKRLVKCFTSKRVAEKVLSVIDGAEDKDGTNIDLLQSQFGSISTISKLSAEQILRETPIPALAANRMCSHLARLQN